MKPLHTFTALLLLCCTAANAYNFDVDGIYYNILSNDDKSVEVTHGNLQEEYRGNITIPAEVTHAGVTYTVASIGEGAFWGCDSLASITLPGSIASINGHTFYGCEGLKTATIEEGTTHIGVAAFACCTALKSLTLPCSVKEIGSDAFSGCVALTSITLPDNITNIAPFTFKGCTGLENIALPCNIETISEAAFWGCTSLENIALPAGLARIEGSAFEGCTALASITIPASTTAIEKHAFNGCTALTSIAVESGNDTYDSRQGCNAIIETATDRLIQGCKKTSIPQNITTIGEWAFYACTGLKKAEIPIGETTIIEDWAYLNCDELSRVTIPKNITYIGEGAFYGCDKLTAISTRGRTPATAESYTFKELYHQATLYVPIDKKSLYQASPYWANFYNIEELIILGDVDSDDIVDVADITVVVAILLKLMPEIPTADVDSDGFIDVADITTIVDIIFKNK